MKKNTQNALKMFKPVGEGEPRRKLDAALVLKHKLSQKQQTFLEEWFNNGHDQLAAYRRVTPQETQDRITPSTQRTHASQIINSVKIQNYLADFSLKSSINPDTEEPIITVREVIQSLADIIQSDTAKDSDKIKASEVVLKHLNAFSDHNSSKSPKILTYINNQSTDDLINEINLLQDELIRDGKLLQKNNYADYEEINEDTLDID